MTITLQYRYNAIFCDGRLKFDYLRNDRSRQVVGSRSAGRKLHTNFKRWNISLRHSILFNLNDPRFQFLLDGITNLSDFLHFLFMSTLQLGRIGEAPVKVLQGPREYRAPLGVGGITDCNHVVETPAAFQKIKRATSGIP